MECPRCNIKCSGSTAHCSTAHCDKCGAFANNVMCPDCLKPGEKYWTDYPFVELGDIPHETAPVRQVTLISYDGNKYCDILLHNKSEDIKSSVKAGYLYVIPQRLTGNGFVKVCEICGKDVPEHYNYCDDWDCAVERNKRNGGVSNTPNGLPIGCIKADGSMWEHEHGDHPNYLFPVEVEYVGQQDDTRYQMHGPDGVEMMDEGWRDSIDHETHALLYADGSIAVTMYETCSAAWMLSPIVPVYKNGVRLSKEDVDKAEAEAAGMCLGGHLWKANDWRLTKESLIKIFLYLQRNRPNVTDA